MANEEAKAFLDNLKICIKEHPIVADWLVEIAERKTEPTISKMEQVDKDINVRSKDEPQTNADQHVQRIEYVGNDEKSPCWTCKHFESMHETPISSDGSYYTYVVCTAKECPYEPKDEPQTNKDFKVTYTCSFTECDNFKNFGFGEKCIECKRKQSEARLEDEPQTDCAWK